MSKLISIIIPTYNMAELLPRCLDSLLNSKFTDLIEAIVVNDGSKDNSLAVANKYNTLHPNVVTVIDKPNGNYGSTINAALPAAKGTYVKILDSDDWFDTTALDDFVLSLSLFDVDMAITHFTQRGAKVNEIVRYNTMGREPYTYKKIYQLDDILPDGHIRSFLMHAVTYRTQLLRDINYRQTEGISYTDTEWAAFPVYFAKDIVFFDINLYQYNLDRDGQTMDPSVIMRSIPQLLKIQDSLTEYYKKNIAKTSEARQSFLKQYMTNRYRLLYKLFLIDMPRKNFNIEDFTAIEAKLHAECDKYNFHPLLFPDNRLIHIDYIKYWRKHHTRWPILIEKISYALDNLARWFYIKIYRS